jgi:hypothetical protein
LSSKEEMVEVYRASGEAEAQIIKGLLESYGIPSLLKSTAAPSVHVFTVDGLGEVRILVWKSAEEEARELIRGNIDA